MKSLQEKLVIEQRNLLSLQSELFSLKSQALGDFTKTTEYAAIISSISDINKIMANIISSMPSQQVYGGNIYIQKQEPSSPQDGDIWFDLALVR